MTLSAHCGLQALHEGSKLSAPLQTNLPTLYTHMLCPYAERVLLTLAELVCTHHYTVHTAQTHSHHSHTLNSQQHPFNAVHVDLSNKPRWYRSINPRGLVPTLVLNPTTTLTESADICQWLVQHQNQDGRVVQAPASSSVHTTIQDVISAGLHCLAGMGRGWGIASPPVPSSVASLERHLDAMNDHLSSNPVYLHGDQPSVDDILVYPFLRRYSVALPIVSDLDVRAGRPHLAQWLDAMAARTSVQLAAADDALLLEAYIQHMCLDFFDYTRYTATQLHPWLEDVLVR